MDTPEIRVVTTSEKVGYFVDLMGDRLTKDTLSMLITLYTEKHRMYHNIDHIFDLLKMAEREEYPIWHPIIDAIIFHDAVYYPNSKFNEELSAALYTDRMHRRNHVLEVYEAIIASKNHTSDLHAQRDPWIKNFLDYDLAGLSTDKYRENGKKIFAEFQPFVGRAAFIAGRVGFLKGMISSKRIYWNHPDWEAAARRNMFDEMEAIQRDKYDFVLVETEDGRDYYDYIYGEEL